MRPGPAWVAPCETLSRGLDWIYPLKEDGMKKQIHSIP